MRKGIISAAVVLLAVTGCSKPIESGGETPVGTAALPAATNPEEMPTTEDETQMPVEVTSASIVVPAETSAPASEEAPMTEDVTPSSEPAPAAQPAGEVGETLDEVAAAIGCQELNRAAAPGALEFADCQAAGGRVQLYSFGAKSDADALLAMAAGMGSDNSKIIWHGLVMLAPGTGVDRDALVAILGEE